MAPPGPREVLVEMVASGVCGSDVHLRDGLLPLPRPMVCGHEGAGIVREVGSEVRRVKPGDHALLAWVPSCGLCRFCAGGSSHLCETVGMALEGKMWDGTTRFSEAFGEPLFHHMMVSSFSRHAVLSEASVVAVPDDLPLAPLALVGCAVATGVGAVVRTAGVKLGDHVAVIGCGGVGLNAVQGARLGGASRIVAVDISAEKLEGARRFGATHIVDASSEDVVAAILSATDGDGVDIGIEAIGRPDTLEQALLALKRGGIAVAVGIAAPGQKISIEMLHLLEERRLSGCYYGSMRAQHDFQRLVDLYRGGRLLIDELITEEIDQADIDAALDKLQRGEGIRSLVKY